MIINGLRPWLKFTMADDRFAAELNSTLFKRGATSEAVQYMNRENIQKIRDSFTLLDPHVQAVIVQSVIWLSTPQFEEISDVYKEIIAIALRSPYDWPKKVATEFAEFPSFNVDQHFADEFNLASLHDPRQNAIRPMKRTQSKQHDTTHFRLEHRVTAPSDALPRPVLGDDTHKEPKRTQVQQSLAIRAPQPSTVPRPAENKPPKKKNEKMITQAQLTQAQRSSAYATKEKKVSKMMNYDAFSKK